MSSFAQCKAVPLNSVEDVCAVLFYFLVLCCSLERKFSSVVCVCVCVLWAPISLLWASCLLFPTVN